MYTNDNAKLLLILQQGTEQCNQNEKIVQQLQLCYVQLASESEKSREYINALSYYDKALEMQIKTSDDIYTQLSNCITKYINMLMLQEQFDIIRELNTKYGGILSQVNFSSIMKEVEKKEKIIKEQQKFLKKIYELMSEEKYDAMQEVDGSDEARKFVETMLNDNCYYYGENNKEKNGDAVGVCVFGDSGYYFYYGQVKDGKKEGKGTSFIKTGEQAYSTYTGNWENDMPNGKGELVIRRNNQYTKKNSGEVLNGLWEGHVSSTLVYDDNEYIWNLDFDVEEGIPINITQQLYDEGVFYAGSYWSGTDEYYNGGGYKVGFGIEDLNIPEGCYLYAFDINYNAPDIDFMYPHVYSYSNGKPMGIFGFE